MKDILIGSFFSFVLFTASPSNAAAPLIPESFTRISGITVEEPTPPPPGQYGTTKSIQQYGITWTFANEVKYGQFVNGDYWVVDPGNGVKIVKITPGYAMDPSTGRTLNGSMLNPSSSTQGYDSERDYSASANVSLNISNSSPLIFTKNSSLVSTISNLISGGTQHISYVKTAAVLTCLAAVPPANSFRPGISSTTKTIFDASDLNYSKLKRLQYPGGVSRIDIQNYAKYFQMVWLDHGGWTTRFMRPSDGIPDNYYYTEYFASAALLLQLDYSDKEKEKLLINLIQLGIDLYSRLERGSKGWPPDGGNMNGRKWPIMFAGIMLDYAPMKDIGQKSGDYLYASGHGPGNPPADYIHFGEDGQTFYVRKSDVDITNSSSWNPDKRNSSYSPYTSAMIGMPEWGIRYSTDPKRSEASWGAMYRTIKTATYSWAGTSMAIRIMGAKNLWNHNVYFDYIDRYMAITKGASDPFGYTVPNQKSGWRPSGLIGEMWDTYRSQY